MFWSVWHDYLSFIFCFVSSVTLFTFHLPRRRLFGLRVLVCAAVWAGTAIGLHSLSAFIPENFSSIIGYIRFAGQYVIALLAVYFSYTCSFVAAMFCATCGYCMQHIAVRLSTIVANLLSIRGDVANMFLLFGCLAVVCAVVYILAIFGKTAAYRDIRISSPVQLVVTLCVLSAIIIVDIRMIFIISDLPERGNLMLYAFILSAMCGVITLMLEINLLSKKHITDDFYELQKLLGDERERYKQEKANIEMINLKCHDIRHQLRAMKGRMDPAAIGELSDAVDVYNTQIKTGNEAIDVVLATQGLYCLRHDIRLTCLIDGSRLNFIPDHELYALFGNAIENAVHAVEGLDKERRVIAITENRLGRLTNISITNYFDNKLRFEDGLPVSSREGHGFGTRSMRMIVEKYGGRLTVKVKGDLFMLNIFLPEAGEAMQVSAG